MKSNSSPRQYTTLQYIYGFQLAWIVAAIICTIFSLGRTVSIGLMIVNLLILFAPALLEKITRTKLATGLTIHFLILVTAASFLGSIVGFYASVPGWDTYVHLYSGVFTVWFGYFIVKKAEESGKAKLPKWFGHAAAFAFSLAIAPLWEIYEFMSDLILHTVMQAGGLEDTIVDMIAALIGTVIGIAVVALFKAPKSVLPKALK